MRNLCEIFYNSIYAYEEIKSRPLTGPRSYPVLGETLLPFVVEVPTIQPFLLPLLPLTPTRHPGGRIIVRSNFDMASTLFVLNCQVVPHGSSD